MDSPRGLRYLRLREVCQRVGLKPSSVYRLIGLGTFPKQVKLSERTSAWIESEVESFMASRVKERDQGSLDAPPADSLYMRMGEVMKRIGLSSSKIYELIRDGAFPKWAKLPKIDSGWLRSDVERWPTNTLDRASKWAAAPVLQSQATACSRLGDNDPANPNDFVVPCTAGVTVDQGGEWGGINNAPLEHRGL
jgi:prophage regulatory protein